MGSVTAKHLPPSDCQFVAVPSRGRSTSFRMCFRLKPLLSRNGYCLRRPPQGRANPTKLEQLYDVVCNDDKAQEWFCSGRPRDVASLEAFFDAYVASQDALADESTTPCLVRYAVELCCNPTGEFGNSLLERFDLDASSGEGDQRPFVYRCVGFLGLRTVTPTACVDAPATAVFEMVLHKQVRLYSEVLVRAACLPIALHSDQASARLAVPHSILIPAYRTNAGLINLLLELAQQLDGRADVALRGLDASATPCSTEDSKLHGYEPHHFVTVHVRSARPSMRLDPLLAALASDHQFSSARRASWRDDRFLELPMHNSRRYIKTEVPWALRAVLSASSDLQQPKSDEDGVVALRGAPKAAAPCKFSWLCSHAPLL
jgi:hypothetical protein